MIAPSRQEVALPLAIDAERWVVGSMLVDPACIPDVLKTVGARDFADDSLRVVFEAINRRHRDGQPVELNLLLRDIKQRLPAESNAALLLAEAGASITTAAHAEHYAQIVAEVSRKRRLYDIAETAREGALNGRTSDEIINTLGSDFDDLVRSVAGKEKRFQAVTAAQLDAGEYSIAYLVSYLLADGQPCILAGPKKCLKTSLLVDLGISIAVGNDLLGHFHVPVARRFLLCSGESGMATLQETSRRVAAAKGWSLADVPNYTLTPDLPRFDDADSMRHFGDFLDGEGIDVVAIDPAYLCMPGDDAGNLFKQGVLLREVSELCQDRGATLILCHHSRKSIADPYAAPELENIAWSGFQEFARQWLLVGRRKAYEPGSGFHELWLSAGGSAGHGGLWGIDIVEGRQNALEGREWTVTVRNASDVISTEKEQRDDARSRRRDERDSQRAEDDRRKVVGAMVKLARPETKTEIATVARIPGSRAKAALVELIDSETVREAAQITKSNGQTYPSYELVEGHE